MIEDELKDKEEEYQLLLMKIEKAQKDHEILLKARSKCDKNE